MPVAANADSGSARRGARRLLVRVRPCGGNVDDTRFERMKGKNGKRRAHRVPLSRAALGILERARGLDDGSGLCFPSPANPGRPLSDVAIPGALRRAGITATAHGMRSAFRDWAAEQTDVPREVCELALAHAVGSAVERSYARSDLFDKRRELMRLVGGVRTRFVIRSAASVRRRHDAPVGGVRAGFVVWYGLSDGRA